MRDHLMGYTPSAERSAEAEEEAEHGWWADYSDTYPLGVPKRAFAENEATLKKLCPRDPRQTEMNVFRFNLHSFPDGTNRTAREDRFYAQALRSPAHAVAEKCREVAAALGHASPVIVDAQKEAADAYMRGYARGRHEDTVTHQMQNKEKAAAFEAARRERIKRNDQQRMMEAMNVQGQAIAAAQAGAAGGCGYQQPWQAESARAMGLLLPNAQSERIYGMRPVGLIVDEWASIKGNACGIAG